MELSRSQAIIMRIKEFGETDLLVSFFTPDQGQLKGVAKGAQKSRKRFVNCLDICSLVNIEYRMKKSGALHFINSGKLIEGFNGIRCNYSNLSKASYMIELTETLFPLGINDPCMFDLLKGSLSALASEDDAERVTLVFEAKAMALGGYGINFEKCCVCGRIYTGAGSAVFIREKGAITCLNCRKPSTHYPEMSPDSINALQQIQGRPIDELNCILCSEEIIGELKPVLKLHREYRLEKRLKTSRFV